MYISPLGRFQVTQRVTQHKRETVMIAALLAIMLAVSCKHRALEFGPVEFESGRVIAMTYVPAGHGTGIGYAMPVGRGGGGIAVTSVTIPERYGIVFSCQHGSFAVDDTKALFSTLQQGMPVTISYRVVYETVEGQRIPVDLDFITATPTEIKR